MVALLCTRTWTPPSVSTNSVPFENFQDLRLCRSPVCQVDVGSKPSVFDAHAHAPSMLIQPRNMFRAQFIQDLLPLDRRVKWDLADVNHSVVNRDFHPFTPALLSAEPSRTYDTIRAKKKRIAG